VNSTCEALRRSVRELLSPATAGDSWHNLEIDTGGAKHIKLLAGAAKNEGITGVQAHDCSCHGGGIREQEKDLFLGKGSTATAFAEIDESSARICKVKDFFARSGPDNVYLSHYPETAVSGHATVVFTLTAVAAIEK
jgi:hypothetical protein